MVSDTTGVCVSEVNIPRPLVEEDLKQENEFSILKTVGPYFATLVHFGTSAVNTFPALI